MRNSRLFGIAPLVLGSFVSINASALAVEGKFRGTYVCEKLPTTRDILRAPLDLIIKGDNVQFARPLYNLNGTRVVGTELAAGTIDGDGRLHLTSNLLGNTANGNYSGSLTKSGGTLTGTQTWTGPGGGRPWSEVARPLWCQHCSNDSP